MCSVAVASHQELVGREAELDRVRKFLSEAAGGPRAMVFRGEAGIGKTMLWRAAMESEDAQRLKVLSTRCVEAELPLGLAGVSDLVEDVFPAVAEELADHERAALEVAIGLAQPQEGPRDAIALPRAFLAILRVLARDAPVLVAIDDVQWLDAPSARVVSFAARRVADDPVGILVTRRDDGSDPLDLANTFGERLADVHLGALSLGALAHLVRTRLGVRIPRPVLARVHEASGGNPMFALEFARAIGTRDGSRLGPVPIPPSLQELTRTRLEQQPRDVRRLLAVVAACEQPTRSLLTAVDPAAAVIVDGAVDAGVLVIGDDGIVRFTHPLLASAAYADLPPSDRRAVHAQLARAVEVAEERARHLALAQSKPDAAVAALLDDAAAHAYARGAPEAAAELAREALRLTPPNAVDRSRRDLSVADHLAAAGRSVEACEWLDRFLATEVTGAPRARALMLRCGQEHDIEAGGLLLDEASAHVGGDAALRAQLFLARSSYYMYLRDFDLAASEGAARQALATAEQIGDLVLVAAALVMIADRADRAGHPDDALLERAMELERVNGALPGLPARERMAIVLLRRGDLGGARELLEAEREKALEAGVVFDRCRATRCLFDVEWRAGDWPLAERYLEDVWSVAVDDGGDRWAEAELPQRRARLYALRGEENRARSTVAEGLAGAEGIHWAHLAAMNRWVLGFLELSLGEPERAWQSLDGAAGAFAQGSLEVLEAIADGVEALVALDRLYEADELLASLRDEASRGHRWAAPAAERCVALLLTARGDLDAAVVAAESSAESFEAIGFPLDRARAFFAAGEALRRSGKRTLAAERIEAAKEIFEQLGAALWVERAETELRRARPRPRRDRELTSAERRVAALVASGLKNREVAAQLFTTEATVEKHLTSVYRKLDVRSRTDLARRVADGSLSLHDA
jgi:DNA-binding CsgD family transcriptional regulator